MPFHECVDKFLGDPAVLRLLDLARETRPLHICYPREVPISRFLAWFFDPTEGHGLGDVCIRALLGEAWRRMGDSTIDAKVRHQLSPTHVASQAFDSCLVRREVKLGSGSLDVLVLDPKRRWLLAIENKYGAGEGRNQLESYETSLAERYPGWIQILVFLDVFGQAPSRPSWIGLDYVWLVDEISAAERSPWLGDDSKAALREFRSVLEPEGAPFVHVDVDDDHLLGVVSTHRDVFEKMREWSKDKAPLEDRLEKIYARAKTLDEKAAQQLFQAFMQRKRLWSVCIPMLLYAGLLQSIRTQFPDIEHDPKRKAFYFSLPKWRATQDADRPALRTMVRILTGKADGEADRYLVVSRIDSRTLSPEAFARVRPTIEKMRKAYLKRAPRLKEEPGPITLKFDFATSEEAVSALLARHIVMLKQEFDDLIRSERLGQC
ncbi:PD-(D/E)XK nuclease family protein [Ideonella oryzae]|uniref:PD-(D/E)XK nuclease family protein n=1 Tax=Ideonella oryzae TaxID=2937441 RepID=A0ABT1BLT6_9BURK|nr:PD-(D/E)XK nuclease family protein [Ideonella oryzae]MCO5977195.1 PD-(D/E)XK nuclease family protein [Ideonella oryzae]